MHLCQGFSVFFPNFPNKYGILKRKHKQFMFLGKHLKVTKSNLKIQQKEFSVHHYLQSNSQQYLKLFRS